MIKLFDVIFKSLAIVIMVGVIVFSAIIFKSCSDTVKVMNYSEIKNEK